MTWRDPKSGEERLNRGTEWFRLRDGKIAEVRAYHHGDKKNPEGDLLGFDHAGRGYTTLEEWKPPAAPVLSERLTVIKDTGERAPLPPFTEEHEELRESVRRFVRKEIAPHVDEWEEAREFPRELFARCGELGFLGLKLPEELRRPGRRLRPRRGLDRGALPLGRQRGVAAGLGARRDRDAADLELRHRGAEPALAGAGDPGRDDRRTRDHRAGRRLRRGLDPTTARRVDGGYVVNGSKTFITNGVRADFLVCAVKTTEEGGHHGISFLVLEREMPGYEVTRKLEKMGWHASDTGELSFTDVEVPEENLLGEENGGFHLIMANFQWERLSMALGAVGGMQRSSRRPCAYAKEREAFGRPIGRFQAIRHKFAEMATKIEVSRALTYLPAQVRGRRGRDREVTHGEALHPAGDGRGRRRVRSRSTAATATCASTGSSAPPRRPPRPDRRRHRRGDEGDPRKAARAVGPPRRGQEVGAQGPGPVPDRLVGGSPTVPN